MYKVRLDAMNFAEKNFLNGKFIRILLESNVDAIYTFMFVQSLYFKIWLYIYKMERYNILLFIYLDC